MKKLGITLFIFFIVVFIIIPSIILYYFILVDDANIIRYDDISLYENNNYVLAEDDGFYGDAVINCQQFLPKYDEFPYKDFISGFYIYDATKTFPNNSSIVLELLFNEVFEYEQFLLYEHNRCEYTDKYDIVYKNYDIYITTNEDLTRFHNHENLPYQFGMLCENKESLMIRYVYYSSHGLYDRFNCVFQNTNCEW